MPKKKVQEKKSYSQIQYWKQENMRVRVNNLNLQVRHKESLCIVDWDNMRNRRPGTDCEQNSLRYFCTAKGGCHIAGDWGKGGWAACRGCLVGAAPGYEVPELECGTPRLHQLILQRRLHGTTTVKWKVHNRTADCFPQTSHRPETPHTDITTGASEWLKRKIFLISSQ